MVKYSFNPRIALRRVRDWEKQNKAAIRAVRKERKERMQMLRLMGDLGVAVQEV